MLKLLAATTVLGAVAVGVPVAVAAPAAADCLADPVVGNDAFKQDAPPVLTTADANADLVLWGATLADCPAVSVTLSRPNGSTATVPLDTDVAADPPTYPERVKGVLPVPLATGAGVWKITKITSGPSSKALDHPFTVTRGGKVVFDQPSAVQEPASSTLTGLVQQYTATGDLVPSASAAVTIRTFPRREVAHTVTDADGIFYTNAQLPAGSTELAAEVTKTGYTIPDSDRVTAVVREAPARMTRLVAATTSYAGLWWRVDGTVQPPTIPTHLFVQDADGTWQSTGSFGYAADDGTFTRWWRPAVPGSYKLKVFFGGTEASRVLDLTVKPRPTTITGTANPTTATVIRPGTRMSTYGHLKAIYTTGVTGAFANQKVVVQTRPRGRTATPYATVATATTTGTGYYYANWTARTDVDVRVAFISPYSTIASSFRWLRVVDVR
jgi:hypothetical protein